MDYSYRAPMMRRSLATPFIRCRARPTRSAPKGCGEAGCVGALPSVMEALVDALGEYDIRHIGMPATSQRVSRFQDRLPFATRLSSTGMNLGLSAISPDIPL